MENPVLETPVTAIDWPDDPDNRYYLKREDLQPYSLGGNKVRIGWEFLQDMYANGCDAMLSYGDLRSNLCRILAGMCRSDGIPARMIATEENRSSETEGFNERIVRLFGIQVRTVPKDRIADAVDEEMEAFRRQGRKPYYIYGNRLGTGNEGTAARAYAMAYREILRKESESGIRYDLIAVPCGTGATQGGLIAGAVECGDADRIIGISISSRDRGRALDILKKTVSGYFAAKGEEADGKEIEKRIHLLTDHHLGGYGFIDERTKRCVREMMRINSVPLAPEYGGKAFTGLVDYLKERRISGKRILFIHTGGLPLFFDSLSAQDRFTSMN